VYLGWERVKVGMGYPQCVGVIPYRGREELEDHKKSRGKLFGRFVLRNFAGTDLSLILEAD
jgi:hypothetical protein